MYHGVFAAFGAAFRDPFGLTAVALILVSVFLFLFFRKKGMQGTGVAAVGVILGVAILLADAFLMQRAPSNQAPHAVVKLKPQAGNPPLVVNFDAGDSDDPDGDILAYAWEFGDGEQGTGITITHEYAAPGAYEATLHVTDEGGLSATGTLMIKVNGPPVARFDFLPISGNAPLAVSFDATTSSDPNGDALDFNWKMGDGTTELGSRVAKTYNRPGHYQITLTVSDPMGLIGTEVGALLVNGPPVARFTAKPKGGNPPLQVHFDASASEDPDGDRLTYAWRFGDGQESTEPTAEHTFTNPGPYSVDLRVSDGKGLESRATATINVNSPPTARFAAEPLAGNPPQEVHFDASATEDPDGDSVRYQWYFGDGTTGRGSQLSHVYEQAGSFRVTLTATDQHGSASVAVKTIMINTPPRLSVQAKPLSGLVPLSVDFDASATVDEEGDPLKFQWDFGDGQGSAGTQVSHTFASAGEYTVNLLVTDGKGAVVNEGTHISVMDHAPFSSLEYRVVEANDQVRLRLNGMTVYEGSTTDWLEVDAAESKVQAGDNSLQVVVFNAEDYGGRRSSRRNRDGWRYAVELRSGENIWVLRGASEKDFPDAEFGAWFVGSERTLRADRTTGAFSLLPEG